MDSDTDADTVRMKEGHVEALLADAEDTHPSAPPPAPADDWFPPPLSGPVQSHSTLDRPPALDAASADPAEPERAGSTVPQPRRAPRRRTSLWVPVLSAMAGLFVGTAALLGVIAVLLLK